MTAIIGLNAFHPDSSACLLLDGKLVSAVAEERLGDRNKHTAAFPINAIRFILADAGIKLSDVTSIAIARQPRANLAAKLKHVFRNPKRGLKAVSKFVQRQNNTLNQLENLAALCGEDPQQMRYSIYYVEHHLAHIASAYYVSPFEQLTAGFSYDGSGDFASMMAAKCEGNRIDILDRVYVPNSLGHFYTAMCQFIGFDLFGEEYKVMGLAPYGEDCYAQEMEKIIDIKNDRWFQLEQKFFDIPRGLGEATIDSGSKLRMGKIYTKELEQLFGLPRARDQEITKREKDIARSTQVMFEKCASKCLTTVSKKVPLTRLVMAGGCSLNGVMNARICREFPVSQMYLQAASSDDGTAVGAAFYCWHNFLNQTLRFEMKHTFLGPSYSESRIRRALETSNEKVGTFSTEAEMLKKTAKLVAAGAVVGWYQGRSEWGPRALGNRSILANPSIPNMKDIINQKIKKRESFRPFAPSVLREEVAKYFEQDIESPFMMHVVKFKQEWRDFFPAVTHKDGTGRIQTVSQENNKRYYGLITEIKQLTGHGIVLNTSFNENEPVVDTPEQAIACFERTDMDVLVLDLQIIVKENFLHENGDLSILLAG